MDMELTQTFLRGKNPCAMGYRWFVRNNLGGGDYQAAMDTQVAAGRVDDARWLLENFGPTNTVLELEHLEADLAPLEAHLGFRLFPLARANASDRRADWRFYFDDDTAEAVARIAAADIARFGYAF